MNARTHSAANLTLCVSLALGGITFPPLLPVAAGAWLGSLLHPDLDNSQSLYGSLHKHRGISHVPVIGTIGRVAWFLGPAVWLLSKDVVEWNTLLLIFAGLCLSDLLHISMDRLGG